MSGSGGGRDDGFSGGTTKSPSAGAGDPGGPSKPGGASGGTAVGGAGAGGGAAAGATGGGGVAGGGGIGGVDACDVVQRAPLNSVKGAASALRVGDELDVFLDESGPRPVLAVRDRHGAVVGSLTHRGHLLLIQCIGQGRIYGAVVLSVSGAAVELRVQLA